MMLFNSILDAVGNTPIVHLTKLSSKLGSDIYIKLEQLNPGGSHKVRIALNIILEAEKKGILTRGSNQVVIAPTGGKYRHRIGNVCRRVGL